MIKGAYLYVNEEGHINRFIFMKYLHDESDIAIFDKDGRDYTATCTYHDVLKLIKETDSVDLLNTNYCELVAKFKNLEKNTYELYLNFAKKQLDNLEKHFLEKHDLLENK